MVESITERVDNPAEAGVTRYVGLEHLDPESLHLRRWGQPTDVEATKLRFWPGDIIYGRRRAYQRKLAVAEFEGICSAHALVVRARPRTVLPEFLPFFMQSDAFHQRALQISVGSLSPTINWGTLAQQRFRIPPLDEQRRIAELLWAADETVESWRYVSDTTEVALQAYRQSVFGDAEHWPSIPLEILFDVELGKMLSPMAKRGSSPKPYLGNSNVQWGRFDLANVQMMDFAGDELKRFCLKKGDLLVCEGGEVGRSAIWNNEIYDCYYQKALHRLRSKDGTITTDYMLQFMFYAEQSGIFRRLTGHSTIAHLTAVKLRSLAVPVPPPEEQQRIIHTAGAFAAAIASSRDYLTRARDVTSTLSNWLLKIGRGVY